jgi:hypothetical protein
MPERHAFLRCREKQGSSLFDLPPSAFPLGTETEDKDRRMKVEKGRKEKEKKKVVLGAISSISTFNLPSSLRLPSSVFISYV